MIDTTKKCPHCEKEIPTEPITEKSIAEVIKLISILEVVAGSMDMSVAQAFEMQLRLGMSLQDLEDGDDVLMRMMKGRIQ